MIERRIRLNTVINQTGIKKTTIYKRVKEGTFPKFRKDGRITYWVESEVQAWVKDNTASA